MTALHFPSWAMCLVLAGSFSTSVFPARAAESLKPIDLRCEYLVNPLGIDVTQPRLMWRLEAAQPSARDLRETNCQVLVAGSEKALAADQGDLWKSGARCGSAAGICRQTPDQSATLLLEGARVGPSGDPIGVEQARPVDDGIVDRAGLGRNMDRHH